MRIIPITASYRLNPQKLNFGRLDYVTGRQTKYDVTAIGGATRDNFYTTKESKILYDNDEPYLAYPLGAKLEATSQMEMGGGAVNTAINLKNLGLSTAIITKVGKDPGGRKNKDAKGREIVHLLKAAGINTDGVIVGKGRTASSVILKHEFPNEFPIVEELNDRTVLADRGVGSTMEPGEIDTDIIKDSRWILIAPLNGNSANTLDGIALYAEENGVNMAMIMGKASIAKGFENLRPSLDTAEILIMNREEASDLTGIKINQNDENDVPQDVKDMFTKIKTTKAKVVVITDGSKGAYAYDGEKYYKSPIFPAKVVNTLGAGDTFASTFVASMIKTDADIEKSLTYASVNSAAVVEHFGAHEGILTFEQMDDKLSNTDFQVKQVYAQGDG